MRPIKALILALGLTAGSVSTAGALIDGQHGRTVSVSDAFLMAPPGTIFVVSENHGFAPHHRNQVLALEELAKLHPSVSVGMEFLESQYQSLVDQFLLGQIPEDRFLSDIKWGSPSFDFYRDQALFPATHGGRTVALNAPRSLAFKVGKGGLASLTDAEKASLPPKFALGNADYFERFQAEMTDSGHIPPDAVERYFEAQSVWDDFMAYNTCHFMKSHRDHVFVVIEGDFHAAYGGGTPDRLKAYGCDQVVVVSQVNIDGMTQEEASRMIMPHPKYGRRAEYVWVESGPQPQPQPK